MWREDSERLAYMDKISEKTGLRKCYIAMILAFYVVICLILALGLRVITYHCIV